MAGDEGYFGEIIYSLKSEKWDILQNEFLMLVWLESV